MNFLSGDTQGSLHLEAPCLGSKVIHRWVAAACHHVVQRRRGEPGLAGNDIVNFTGQCDCNPIKHPAIVSTPLTSAQCRNFVEKMHVLAIKISWGINE